MTTEFSNLYLSQELVQAVTDLGFVEPTPIQAGIIPLMISGLDVIGQAQTGTGKTAAFALPILNNLLPDQEHVQSLVLVPTRELAIQVAKAFTEFASGQKVRVLAVYGGQSYGLQIGRLKRGVDVVVGTPGRLLDLMRRNLLDIHQVQTVVLDEADEMLSMGFIEDMETILSQTPATRQTALFSATLPTEIRRLADKYMRTPESVTIQREQVTVLAIEQRYYLVNEADRLAALTRLFEVEEITSALIFVRTRMGTGDLANELTVRGFPAEALNGDLSQEARERTLNRFRQNQIKVLVATDVAARGLDIDNISHVFNYELPYDPEIYVHRIGRTGRAGKSGIAISLVAPQEKRLLRMVEQFTRQRLERFPVPTEADILSRRETRLMNQVGVWLQRGRCRRERELVEQLVAEGHDPLEVAAVALKVARAEEKQRPVWPVNEVVEQVPRREYNRSERRDDARPARYDRNDRYDRPERQGRTERPDRSARPDRRERSESRAPLALNEPGMVRLSLNLGRRDGIRPNDVVGAIAYHADIPGSVIGKIQIQDTHTLVDVPERFVGQVLEKAGAASIRRQPIALQRV